MNSKPTKKKQYFSDKNTVEALRDSFGSIGDTVKSQTTDFAKESMSDLWAQFFGATEGQSKSQHGDLEQGKEFSLANNAKKVEKKSHHVEPGINYVQEILHGEKRITHETEQALQYQIQEILVEIKQLAAASQELQIQFREVTSEQRIVKAGKYHINLFTFVLKIIRDARQKVESSSSFMSALHSKKKDRGYWQMFKKHGTSFGMSNERNVATQVG